MTTGDLAGKVQTVLGPIGPEELGVTMTHEHIMFRSRGATRPLDAEEREFFERPVSMETLGRIRYYHYSNGDNSRLDDVPTAIDEIELYKKHGGGSLVDATSIGIGRNPAALAQISRATGVNIVMGGSYYIADYHPSDMGDISEDEIVEQIVGDVTEGVDGTGVKTGVIGETGCSWPLEDNERKVLRASARAQRLTGAPVLIHPGRNEAAPMEIIDVLDKSGADLERTIMGHLDRTVFQHDNLRRIAEAGCYLEWDLFGRVGSFYSANRDIDMPSDAQRMDDIAWVSSQGYGRRVLVAHDICTKSELERYGGHGYGYIVDFIAPQMRDRGFSQQAVDDILVNNPAAALTFS